MKVATVALLLAMLSAAAAAGKESGGDDSSYDKKLESEDVIVEYVGNSGKLRLYPADKDDAKESSITISMGKLEELNADGSDAKNKVTSFASQDFTWEDHGEVDVGGAKTKEVAFVSSLTTNKFGTAEFRMTTNVFLEDGKVTYGEGELEVLKGQLKFTVEIKDWPFEDPASGKLAFSINVLTKNGEQIEDEDDADNNAQTLNLAKDGTIEMPKYALVDCDDAKKQCTQKDIEVTTSAKGQNAVIDFVFPAAASIYYDPVVAVGDFTGYGAGFIALMLCIAFFVILAIACGVRKFTSRDHHDGAPPKHASTEEEAMSDA